MIRKWKRQTTLENDNPYELSFSDMMSGLLMVFILATIVLVLQLINIQVDLKTEKEQLTKAEKVREELLVEIRDALHQEGILVHLSENSTILRIPESVISFKSASYYLPTGAENERKIRRIGEVIDEKLNQGDRKDFIDTVFVEGHTDSKPYKDSKIKGNWGLSTFRAIQLWEFWASSKGSSANLQKLVNKDNKLMFSVSGYADTRPIICIEGVTNKETTNCNETYPKDRIKEAYSKNRRIDIRFTVRKPKSEEFEGI